MIKRHSKSLLLTFALIQVFPYPESYGHPKIANYIEQMTILYSGTSYPSASVEQVEAHLFSRAIFQQDRPFGLTQDYLTIKPSLPPTMADYAIVFSYDPLRAEKPNNIMKERLRQAAQLYKQGKTKKILLSGSGPSPHEIWRSWKSYLESIGVPAQVIEFEDQVNRKNLSSNTYENILISLNAVSERGGKTAIFVSSGFHMERMLRYYAKVVKEGGQSLQKLYWQGTSDQAARDGGNYTSLLVHEIFATIRDRQKYGNQLFSPQKKSDLAADPRDGSIRNRNLTICH